MYSTALESSVTDELGVESTIAREIDILGWSVKVNTRYAELKYLEHGSILERRSSIPTASSDLEIQSIGSSGESCYKNTREQHFVV